MAQIKVNTLYIQTVIVYYKIIYIEMTCMTIRSSQYLQNITDDDDKQEDPTQPYTIFIFEK